MTAKSLDAARAEADVARDRLLAKAHEVQARLKPAAVVEQVRSELKRNAESGAERVLLAARKRPWAVGGAAAGAAALLLARPLVGLVRGSRNKGDGPRHGDNDGGQTQVEGRGGGRRRR